MTSNLATHLTLTARLAILTAVAVSLPAATAGWLIAAGGSQRIGAVLVAALVCWLAAAGALVTTLLAGSSRPLVGALGGMLIRFGLPLGVGTGLTVARHELAVQGVFSFIVGYYLLLLPVETWLSLPSANKLGTAVANKDR